jgi:hypothetical protein
MKANKVFVAWQDQHTREWRPVGILMYFDGLFTFCYTKGAEKAASFGGFPRMERLDRVYEAEELFPVFQNRLLSEKRPEYDRLMTWLNVPKPRNPEEMNETKLTILALTEGRRRTDFITVFPCPTRTPDGEYDVTFFVHGLSHMAEETTARVNALEPGAPLFLMHDRQNRRDPFALVLRTEGPLFAVGYCPRYFAKDFSFLLERLHEKELVRVLQVNPDAPTQFRLLCRFRSPWPRDFDSCSGEEFQTIPDISVALVM